MPSPSLEQQVKAQFPLFDYSIPDDFIGCFDGIFSFEYCQHWIEHFEKVKANGGAVTRVQESGDLGHLRKDQTVGYPNSSLFIQDELRVICKEFNHGFWGICYPLYAEKYSSLKLHGPHNIYNVRIQKTSPSEGYHTWHDERQTRELCHRLLAFTLYLNDVEEGGETEFLYLKRRVLAKAGRLAIWPSGFTHMHRGNPPLRGDKYIMTGWVEL